MRLTATRTSITSGGGAVLDAIQQEDPTLDLQFSENKTLTDDVSGDNLVTFTRASSGTYVGADGLIKTTPVNLVQYSEQFDNANWVKTNVSVTANSVAAPDGTFTADFLAENTAAGLHQLETSSNLYNAVINEPYTHSVHVKPNGRNEIGLGYRDAGLTIFNLSTNSITIVQQIGAGGSITNNSIEALSDGWYRISSTIVDQVNYGRRAEVFLCNGGSSSYTGDGSSGAYVWGYQVEEGTTATDYIPTTSTISGAPRFDHDPATGESLGLLIEESRTNELLQSSTLDGYGPSGISSKTPNAGIAPDGTNTAVLGATTSDGVDSHLRENTTQAINTTYTYSFFAKPGTVDYAVVYNIAKNGVGLTWFNVADGTIGTTASGVTPFIKPAGNGWYRVGVTQTTDATIASNIVDIRWGPGDGLASQTAGENLYVWGAQLEEGSFPTSYIPTEGSTVTRAADVAEITGNKFAKTNLLQYSERFDDAYWTRSGVLPVVPNAGVAPDGSYTADKFVPDTSQGLHYLFKSFAAAAAGTYTASAYIKAGEYQYGGIRIVSNSFSDRFSILVDLNTGAVTSTNSLGSPSPATYAVQSTGDGWYRLSVTLDHSSGDFYFSLFASPTSSPTYTGVLPSYAGDGTSGIYLWGAQLEEGSVLTDYTPSVESFVSRASSATYVDDTTGLITTTPVNLLTRSEEFDQWQKLAGITVTANSIADPSGNLTADTIVSTAANEYIYRSGVGTAGVEHTFSVWLKADTARNVGYIFYDNISGVQSGTFAVSTDWQRFEVSKTFGAGATDRRVGLAWNTPTTFYAWGAQLEEGSTATPYIRTTSTISGAARYENGELLLEEARTNFTQYSSLFSNPYWTKNQVIITQNAAIAPDGTLTAEKITPNTNTAIHGFKRAGITTNASRVSVYVKYAGWRYIAFMCNINASTYGVFDLLDGTASLGDIVDVGGGWYRIISTQYPGSSVNTWTVSFSDNGSKFYNDQGGGSQGVTLTGDGTSGAYFWGFQAEEGSYPTSYIPTSGTTVTRAADVSTSALGVDSFYNQDEGTWFTEFANDPAKQGSYQGVLSVGGNNIPRIEGNLVVGYGGSTSFAVTDLTKAAVAYGSTEGRAINGSVQSGSGGTLDTETSVAIGTGAASSYATYILSTTIKRLAYFPVRLPDATLQNITS